MTSPSKGEYRSAQHEGTPMSATLDIDPGLAAGNHAAGSPVMSAEPFPVAASTAAWAASRSTGPSARIRSPSIRTRSCASSSATSEVRRATCTPIVISRLGRQLLLGRRRARDHRPAGASEGARAADVHAHDRRPGEGDAHLPATDRRRHRRHLCAGAGAILAMASDMRIGTARSARRRSCSTASGSPAATWAPARCCRASIGQGRASELLFTGRSLGGDEAERWGFFNRLCRAGEASRKRRWPWRATWSPGRPSPTASPRRCSIRNGR